MDLSRRQVLAVLLAGPLASVAGADERSDLITKTQEDRLKKLLPRTFAKLQRRESIYVAVCGDELSALSEPGADPAPSSHVLAWYGRFLDRLGAAFFYHGGVVDLNPVPALSAKELERQWAEYRRLRAEWEKTGKGSAPAVPGLPVQDPSGPERLFGVNELFRLSQSPKDLVNSPSSFFVRNYAQEGAVSVQVFDPLSSQVFHTEEWASPDIVFIGYGARDALGAHSLATCRKVLEAAVKVCREKGADVVLAGPPPAVDEADERSAIGRARPWAAVAREVAEAAGVFFADLGAAAVFQPSDLLNRTVENHFRAAIEPVRRMFDHGGRIQDGLHPNAAAHRRMGETTAEWLLNGEPARAFDFSGTIDIGAGPDGEDVLTLRAARKSDTPLTIAVSPLKFTGWDLEPGSADRFHTFQPGRGARLFRYAVVRSSAPVPGHDEFVRGSVIVSDDDRQHLVDVKVRAKPLTLLWPEERIDGATGDCLLKCILVNSGPDDIEASLMLDWMGKKTALPAVKIAAGEQQPVPVRLPLPPVESTFRFKNLATISVSAGHTVRFSRLVEGVRHLGLGQKLPLVPLSRWRGPATAEDAIAFGAQLTVTAHRTGVFFQIEVPPGTVSDAPPGKPWGRLEVQIDGREAGSNGTLGCVGKVMIDVPREDGKGTLIPVRQAAFGRFFPFPYDPKGFRMPVTTRPDGGRSLAFNMARDFIPAHEWSLDGSGQSDLGINVRLMLFDAEAGGNSDARTYVLAASGFPSADARSLTLLELRDRPQARWSLRIG